MWIFYPASVILLVSYMENVEGFNGIEPIPRQDLYQDYFETSATECRPANIKTRKKWLDCLETSAFHQDYACRYLNFIRPSCYCCGKIFHYIEYGKVCTKFCPRKSTEEPRYGQDKLIELPFNWGGYPERITLEDGRELEVTSEEVGEAALYSDYSEQETPNEKRSTTLKPRVIPAQLLPLTIANKTTERTKPERNTTPTNLPTRRPTVTFKPKGEAALTTTTKTTSTTTSTIPTRRPTVTFSRNGQNGRPGIKQFGDPQSIASSISGNENFNSVRVVANLREIDEDNQRVQERPTTVQDYNDKHKYLVFGSVNA